MTKLRALLSSRLPGGKRPFLFGVASDLRVSCGIHFRLPASASSSGPGARAYIIDGPAGPGAESSRRKGRESTPERTAPMSSPVQSILLYGAVLCPHPGDGSAGHNFVCFVKVTFRVAQRKYGGKRKNLKEEDPRAGHL